jgi:cytochrome c biogenesis protein CcdA
MGVCWFGSTTAAWPQIVREIIGNVPEFVAVWLGILTSISPCPLATNIAAISYIGRRVGHSRQVILSGLLYTVGRTLAYLGLAILLVAGTLSVPQLSQFVQKYMHQALGPILIIAGMFLLGLIQFSFGGSGVSEQMQKRVDAWGTWGALLLGVVFALSFCPVSAAIFFLSLIPLALEAQSSVVLPSLYGVGTALPVAVFAVLIAWSARSVGQTFHVLTKLERWARVLTGWVFVVVGICFSLKYIFEVL